MSQIACRYCGKVLGTLADSATETINPHRDVTESCLATPAGYICLECIKSGKHNGREYEEKVIGQTRGGNEIHGLVEKPSDGETDATT